LNQELEVLWFGSKLSGSYRLPCKT
jgi:hypothetical protein